MVKAGLDLDFAFETLNLLRVGTEADGEDLHGFDAPADKVFDLIHRAAAAGADDTQEFVIRG